MSFARWENMQECKVEQMKIGHDEKAAETICEGIMERAEKGTLFKGVKDLEILKGVGEDLVVGGIVSWELVDPQNDYVTTEAMVNFLDKFFKLPPEYHNVTIDHTNFQIGKALLHYPEENPKFFTHVHEKGMYGIVKIRDDTLQRTQYYRHQIKDGIYKMFSIAGDPIRKEYVMEGKEVVRKIYDIDPFEWAIVKEGYNPKANFEILKSKCPSCVEHLRDKYMAKGIDEKTATDKAIALFNRVYARMEREDKIKKQDLQKPFADYASWEECMADCHANHPDVNNCEAWCGRIKAEAEGKMKPEVKKGANLTFRQEAEAIFHKHFPEYKGE